MLLRSRVLAPHAPSRSTRGGVLLKLLKLLGLLGLGAIGLTATMAWHVWRLSAAQTTVPHQRGITVNAQAAAQHLSAAVQLPTIWSPEDEHGAAFEALHRLLQTSFPAAHAVMQRETLGRHALLYTWPGSDPKAQPVALLAHQDVVPVAPGTEGRWQHPPYSGVVQDGFVWGRGAWDDKGNLMSMMEAIEALAQSGFKPRQTIYLAFGADEEVGGDDGARRIAELLRQRGVKLRFAIDEGLLITHGMVPGVAKPVALIGVAEKGFATLKLTAIAQPGHSSMPPPRSAIGVLGEAVARVEAQQMPAHLTGLPREMFEAVAPEVSGVGRVLLSNLWLTRPLMERELQKAPSTNAMLRSTGVATIFHAGERENVLAGVATASINFRLLPGDTEQAVIHHVKALVDDLGVKIELQPWHTPASPVSRTDSEAYRVVAQSLRELQPGVVVAPGLLVGATDSRHYAAVADNIFRFSPVHAATADLARFHGTNERISVANYVEMIQFYERLLRRVDAIQP
jgi:carboxypeptidase PM20D1